MINNPIPIRIAWIFPQRENEAHLSMSRTTELESLMEILGDNLHLFKVNYKFQSTTYPKADHTINTKRLGMLSIKYDYIAGPFPACLHGMTLPLPWFVPVQTPSGKHLRWVVK